MLSDSQYLSTLRYVSSHFRITKWLSLEQEKLNQLMDSLGAFLNEKILHRLEDLS